MKGYLIIIFLLLQLPACNNAKPPLRDLETKRISLTKEEVKMLEKRAGDLFNEKEYDEGYLCYDTLVLSDPQNAFYYFRRGFCQSRYPTDLVQVISDYKMALTYGYENVSAIYFNLASIYQYKENFDSSLQYYNKYLILKPNDSIALNERNVIIRRLR